MAQAIKETTVGRIDEDVLAFTAGEDRRLDLRLAEYDCLGSAAHVKTLARLRRRKPIFTPRERDLLLRELTALIRVVRRGAFTISAEDQDVHLAVERRLTDQLGPLGKRIHTGRSRNDQVAVDLRLFTRDQLLESVGEAADLGLALLTFARRHRSWPMVGRTHLQPAMPSSVGLWAAAHAESLLDDVALLITAYDLNNRCPLGAGAAYGVPLPLDRKLTSDLLGFEEPVTTVLYAVSSRGKMESVVLSALSQVMLSLSRLAEDLVLYSMPEFAYFQLPDAYTTGSSIMPQKKNPDVCELIRAKAARLFGELQGVLGTVKALPSGYQRDVQETKGPLLGGFDTARASLRIMARLVRSLRADRRALLAGFSASVFATDRALERVADGMPFRDAYREVKEHLDELESIDPRAALETRSSIGAPGHLDLETPRLRLREALAWAREERRHINRALSRLLGLPYPKLESSRGL